MSAEAPLERERRLQGYRNYFGGQDPDWNAGDLAALDWIDSLAASGHFGATRLLARMLRSEDVLKRLHSASPGTLEALAVRLPRVAFFLVLNECAAERLDIAAIERWLGSCDGVLRERFMLVPQVLRSAGAALGASDGRAMADLLRVYWENGTQGNWGFHGPDDLLVLLAKPRLASSDARVRAAGVELLQRAFELGNREARQLVWRAKFLQAEDKQDFYAKWLADCINPSDQLRRACLEHGASLERGSGGRREVLEEAATWYWRALYNHTITQRPNLLQDESFCRRVGEAFDAGEKEWLAKLEDAELSNAWYRRAAALKE